MELCVLPVVMFDFLHSRKRKAVDYQEFDVSGLLDLVYHGNNSVLEMESLQWTALDGDHWRGVKFTFVSQQTAQRARDLIAQTFPFIQVEINNTVRPPILLARWPVRDYRSQQ